MLSLSLPLPLGKLIRFVSFCQISKPTIELGLRDNKDPPEHLPTNIAQVIAGAICEDMESVQSSWGCFKHEVWQMPPLSLSEEDVRAYNVQALPQGTCEFVMSSTWRVCPDNLKHIVTSTLPSEYAKPLAVTTTGSQTTSRLLWSL